jgi:uncharacterized membrane protein YkoI
MRKSLTCWFIAGFGAVLFAADQPAGPLQLGQLPPAVQKAIQGQAANGKIGEITRDNDNGSVNYVVEITKGTQTRDYTFDEAGTLVGMEMTLQELPLEVQKTIQAQAAQGTIDSIEKSIDGGAVSYDVDWKSRDGKDHSFTVLENGKLDSLDVSLDETPPPVKGTITHELGTDKLVSISKTMEDDGVYYDVTFVSNGVERDFSVAESGKMDSRQVLLTELPPSVLTTIDRIVGQGKVVRVDQVFEKAKGGPPFEVESIVNGKTYYFRVGQKGAFLGAD